MMAMATMLEPMSLILLIWIFHLGSIKSHISSMLVLMSSRMMTNIPNNMVCLISCQFSRYISRVISKAMIIKVWVKRFLSLLKAYCRPSNQS